MRPNEEHCGKQKSAIYQFLGSKRLLGVFLTAYDYNFCIFTDYNIIYLSDVQFVPFLWKSLMSFKLITCLMFVAQTAHQNQRSFR